jgi:hypothetical protein
MQKRKRKSANAKARTQKHERKSANAKARMQKRERKSANAKAPNLRPKKERERVPPGARKRKREDPKKARAQLCVYVHLLQDVL